MDNIKQLTIEELQAIAYASRCWRCLCELIEGKYGNYWGCNGGCERKTCDDCHNTDGLTEKEEEEMKTTGYVCECCRKEDKEADKSK